jgi:hypothetical protein
VPDLQALDLNAALLGSTTDLDRVLVRLICLPHNFNVGALRGGRGRREALRKGFTE